MGFLESIKKALGIETVDYSEVLRQGGILIDVRTPTEFKSGHAKGSQNIPLQNLSSKINKLKNKEVVLVCRSGGRAAQAKGLLKQNGIKAYNAGSWRRMA